MSNLDRSECGSESSGPGAVPQERKLGPSGHSPESGIRPKVPVRLRTFRLGRGIEAVHEARPLVPTRSRGSGWSSSSGAVRSEESLDLAERAVRSSAQPPTGP